MKMDLGCIYCGAKGNYSREHYLPEGLGAFQGLILLKNRICVICNSRLTQIESPFLKTSPIGLFRAKLNIRSKKRHKAESPFYKGDHGTSPIQIFGIDPDNGIEILYEVDPDPDKWTGRQLRQIVIEDPNGKTSIIPIKDFMSTADDFQKYLKDHDIALTKPSKIYLYAANEEEKQWLLRLLPNKTHNINLVWNESKANVISVYSRFSFEKTFFRCISKIAFHYFLLQYFDYYSGHEKEFQQIKDFIMNGIGEVESFIHTEKTLIYEFRRGKTLSTPGHILIVNIDRWITSQVNLCVGSPIPDFLFRVVLGENPLKIHPDIGIGHSYFYYPPENRIKYDGIMEKLAQKHLVHAPNC